MFDGTTALCADEPEPNSFKLFGQYVGSGEPYIVRVKMDSFEDLRTNAYSLVGKIGIRKNQYVYLKNVDAERSADDDRTWIVMYTFQPLIKFQRDGYNFDSIG